MINLSTKGKVFLALGVALVGVVLFFGLRALVEPEPPAVAVPPSVQLVESRLVGRRAGQRQWEIVSRTVLQEGDLVTLSDLEEMVVFQDEEPYLRIDTPKAEWQRQTEVLKMYGPVVVEGKDDFRLESDFLIWDGRTGTLSSPGPVQIHWKGLEITAEEMAMDTEKSLVHLKRNVVIREGSLAWRLEEVLYDLDAESMDFFGNVVLEGETGSESE